MKQKLAGLVTGLVIFFLLVGCTTGSYSVLSASENNTSTSLSMTYSKLNGFKSTTLTVKENEVSEVSVDIISKEGKLNLVILDEKDQYVYQGNDLPTSSFSVKLDKAGKYTIKVTGEKHTGSYNIAWNTTDKE